MTKITDISIRTIDYAFVYEFSRDMKKSGVVVDDSPDTIWIGAYADGSRLVGVTAITLSKNSARIRSSYVHPDYRKCGVYRIMVQYAEGLAVHFNKSKVTAFFNRRTVPYAYAHGYTVKEPNKNGVCFAEKIVG